MTHDEMIAVITHHKSGGKVQIQGNISGKWNDDESPKFNFYLCNYRAKPDPLVLWIAMSESGDVLDASASKYAVELSMPNKPHQITLKKFVEVTE